MGRMTLKQFRDYTASGIQRTSPELIGLSLVDTWIFNTMVEFGYAFKFRELEGYEEQVLLAGVDALVFPEDFRMLHELGIELIGVERFEGKLLRESRDEYIKANRTIAGTFTPGRPKRYSIFGPLFKVRPVGDVDYTAGVHYWRRLIMMDDEIDPAPFQDDWDDIILVGAQSRGFRHFNEFDRYQNMRNDFLGMVRSRAFEEDLEEFPEGGIMPVTWKDTEDESLYGRDIRDEIR